MSDQAGFTGNKTKKQALKLPKMQAKKIDEKAKAFSKNMQCKKQGGMGNLQIPLIGHRLK